VDELYQDHILDHYERPRHYGTLADADCSQDQSNPLCGDQLHVDVRLDQAGAHIEAVAFHGRGCVISQATASMLMEAVVGRSVASVQALERQDVLDILGITLSPARMKCALLSLRTLKMALYNCGTLNNTGKQTAP
jgi:nitrogen fixation NifU-like protein